MKKNYCDFKRVNISIFHPLRFNLICKMTHYDSLDNAGVDNCTFRFLPDSMHIEIMGGLEKTHPKGVDLTIDAKTLSKDTSYPPHEQNQLDRNKIQWRISPHIPGIITLALVLKIPSANLKVGKVYRFQLTVERNKIADFFENKTATQIVTITDPASPDIFIECIRNCIDSNSRETTTLKVICKKNCESDPKYKWSTSPELDKSKKDFGDGFDKLVILPDAFKPGDTVQITASQGFGTSSLKINFIKSVEKGTCIINPKEGISGVTKFKVTCNGFHSDSGGLKYMIYQQSEEVETGIILNEDVLSNENEVFLTTGSPARIIIKVQDDAFAETQFELTAEVKPFIPKNMSKIAAITNQIFGDNPDSLSSKAIEKSRTEVIQMASYLLDALNEIEVENYTKMFLHKKIALSIQKSKPVSFGSILQTHSILTKLQKMKLGLDTQTPKIIAKTLKYSMIVFHKIIKSAREEIPMSLQIDMTEKMFELASLLTKEEKEVEKVLEEVVPAHDYESYDDMVSDKIKMFHDLMEVTDLSILCMEMAAADLLYGNYPEQKELSMSTETMSMVFKRVYPSSLINVSIGIPEETQSSVNLSLPLIQELQNQYDAIDYQFMYFKNKPFWWHKNQSNFNTDFVMFNLLHSYNKIVTTKNPFQVTLNVKKIPTQTLKGTLSGTTKIYVQRILLESDLLLQAAFKSSNEKFKVTTSECYCTEEDFGNGIEIEANAKEEDSVLNFRSINGKEALYLCIQRLGESNLTFEVNIFSFSCVYWNSKTGFWDSKGCKTRTTDVINKQQIECECTHASLFTGVALVSPNKINFSKEIDFLIDIVENWMIIIFVLLIFCIWIILLVWAYFEDKKMSSQNFIVCLDDNVPGDSHPYLVVVFTGAFLDAETSADVAFQIEGDEANSRVHLIKACNTKLLKRNSQDWIVIYTPEALGKINKIRLWHNCSGRKPHWYCQRVVVQDLKTKDQYCFIVKKWFSLVWGDGNIYREINVQPEKLKSSKILFNVKFGTQIQDKHLWLSVFTRDPQSSFTSKERVSSGITVLYLSMLTSAMFYGIPKKTPSDSIDSRSSFYIDLQQVIIFLESTLVSFPISFLVIFIFRNSAPKIKGKLKEDTLYFSDFY